MIPGTTGRCFSALTTVGGRARIPGTTGRCFSALTTVGGRLSTLSTAGGPFGIPGTTGGRLSALSTTGSCVSTTSATIHVSSPDGCTDHRPGTPDAALHLDRLDRAVEGTGSALHTPGLVDQHCRLFAFSKDAMGADLAAPPAVDTPLREIRKGILAI